jgi:hypothetical protein
MKPKRERRTVSTDRCLSVRSTFPTSGRQLAVILSVFGAIAAVPQSLSAQTLPTAASPSVGPPASPVRDGSATLVAHYDHNQKLRLVIGLKTPDPVGEEQFLKELHDKKSPQFHRFLTAAEWNSRFAPTAQDEQAVLDWARTQNLTVTHRYPNRLLVDLEATAGAIETALNVTINNYKVGAVSFFSNDREVTIPATLRGIIHSVGGLNNHQVLLPAGRAKEPTFPNYVEGPVVSSGGSGNHLSSGKKPAGGNSSGPVPAISGGAYDPTDIYDSQAYDTNALDALGHCCNPLHNPGVTPPQTSIAIATAGTQDGNDFTGFHNTYPYLADHWQQFYIDGTPPCCDGEGTMDMEWATAMANSFGSYVDTAMVYMYDGVNTNFSTFTDIYNQILTDGLARVFSTSWGCAEFDCVPQSVMDTDHAIFNAMIGQGWTLINSAGDGGATAGCHSHDAVSYPATDPNFVAAGGTTLSLFAGPLYNFEVAWTGGPDGCAANDGGGTGGFSAYWATPSYQSSFGFGSRAVPDMSLNADWFNTPQNIYFGGSLQGNGGTSIVAPELAGFFAQANAYLLSLGNICGSGSSACAPMGNANFYLYDAGLGSPPHFPFYDITSGCNNNDITALYGLNSFCAGPGYDEATGWGSANMLQLAWAINWFSAAAVGSPSVTFSGPAVNTWYNTNQIVSWSITDNGGGAPPTGVAGFTEGWDSIPADPYSEATSGSGNSFYSGPQFPNATTGSLSLSSAGQGCHRAEVQAWNNMGSTAGAAIYGPLCYDTLPPVTTGSLSGTLSGGVYISPVTVTLTGSDSGSGVASTVYQLDGGAVTTYTAPFTLSALGSHTTTFHSTDKAGNVEGTESVSLTIHSKTATTVVSSLNPSTYGVAVTFTATVTSSGGTPSGTVTFKDGAATLGTGTLSGGITKLATSTLAGGSHSITALYAGSGNFNGSTSAALTQTVNMAGSSTTLSASVNPSAFGQPVTFTATVKSATTGTPAGSVTFKDGATVLGTQSLNASGVATLATASLSVGSHSLTADYAGNVDFNASASPSLAQTVKKAGSSTTLSSSVNPSEFDRSVTFTATVKSATMGTLGGSVTFKDGATVLGTQSLDASGVATLVIASLSVGPHSITTDYAGNADFNASTSAILAETVNKATTTISIVSSLNPSIQGQAVTFTATVTPAFGGSPTGTVTFKDGATVLSTVAVNVSTHKAAYTRSALATGTHSITAVYSGDTDFSGITSKTLTQTVNP